MEKEENTEESREGISSSDVKEDQQEDTQIFVVKVTTNKEDNAFDMIRARADEKNLDVFSIARPQGLRGYIFLEAKERDVIEEAAFNLPYVKGILPRTVTYKEIEQMMEPKVEEINIKQDDIVEITADPFKKEKAKVSRIDRQKGEVVVTLLQAAIPIPVTVNLDDIRILRREEQEEMNEESE